MAKKYKFATKKLVRDKLPSTLSASGVILQTRTVEGAEYIAALKAKLQEEVIEVLSAKNPDELLEELADVCEVVRALVAAVPELSYGKLIDKRQEKFDLKGGFEAKIYCESIEISADHPRTSYYLSKPDIYPLAS